ncbi:nucleotide exchange factor GrpE [Nakamurella sp. YIM 132087]|uniref:Protein GrpE n=1 Tax=Nakamurella alba TaxID=2665158 RepID=A0A7K1FP52_9ACTN|nr:nucleotide exchange factor GrpE [Nakamurella alba]MTD15921.1 nucleotide exchange factor GrpE [Nakamurella alba]
MSHPENHADEPRVVVNDKRRIDPETGGLRTPGAVPPGTNPADPAQAGQPITATVLDNPELTADLEAAKQEAAERTADLQRVSAEYANYRKRVDRDREVVAQAAKARVLTELLPVLDDVDRAAAHGDVTGAFKATADKLAETLQRLGLTGFGAKGDLFDPAQHEAVHFATSADVTEQTVTEVLRTGYLVGDKLVRPAVVVVTGPDPDAVPAESAAGDPAGE